MRTYSLFISCSLSSCFHGANAGGWNEVELLHIRSKCANSEIALVLRRKLRGWREEKADRKSDASLSVVHFTFSVSNEHRNC